MTMLVPVIQTAIQSLGQLIEGLKVMSLQGQRTQLLPPRLDQVQPTSIFGNELQLHFWPGSQSQFDLVADMDRQVILNNQPTIGRKSDHDFLQELNVAGTVPSRTEQRNGLSTGWLHHAPTISRDIHNPVQRSPGSDLVFIPLQDRS
jgi:hypothetical protein